MTEWEKKAAEENRRQIMRDKWGGWGKGIGGGASNGLEARVAVGGRGGGREGATPRKRAKLWQGVIPNRQVLRELLTGLSGSK